jgi:rhamnose transport system ATP-binding protein
MDFSIERNIALASLDSVQRAGLIPRGAERRFAKDWALRLQLRYGKLSNPAWTLSGGNQQKAVLAKWLARKPTLLIVDEPTRGIDVGTKAEVHRLLSELAAQGVAVLMISSELPEVLGMADRIVVLFEGRVMREFERAAATEDAIMRAATGMTEEAA